MITNTEIDAVKLAPEKQDFYQIWNEILDTAKKLSERWDPTSTNENDPGIVLLKVATALADKLNYNTDKKIFEAFMPSAAQMESMRKLCEMMGYNVKYYRSATTTVKVAYTGSEDLGSYNIPIDLFSNIKNTDDDINYVTTELKYINASATSVEIPCIEGQFVWCSTNDDSNIISADQLDDNDRYYLPETQIAENGIFVYNIEGNDDSAYIKTQWDKVDNLNSQPIGTTCYKFGYDSSNGQPYVQFPDDISTLIEDGLYIGYIRTNGVNGNISARTLTTLETPESWSSLSGDDTTLADILVNTNFSVVNASAASNGSNIESIDEAYNNFKKTIGTFDTLVTCRDYMNAIYNMTVSDTDTTPLVSNIIVSDIRDDINRSNTICSFDQYGMCYEEVATTTTDTREVTGKDSSDVTHTITISETEPRISSFDLVVYPFKYISSFANSDAFNKSFNYSTSYFYDIKAGLEDTKCVHHTFITPETDDIACIKNKLKLNGHIATTYKVNSTEQAEILKNVYKAIYEQFNMRELDFGEEIPTESIRTCILGADSRIKDISLDDPTIETVIMKNDNTEYSKTDTDPTYKALFNTLTRRNVLAGRIPLFNYYEDFKGSFSEANTTIYPTATGTSAYKIMQLRPKFTLAKTDYGKSGDTQKSYTLTPNEIIQCRCPNFKTTVTYPSYVNYYLKLGTTKSTAAEMVSLKDIYDNMSTTEDENLSKLVSKAGSALTKVTADTFNSVTKAGYKVFKLDDKNNPIIVTSWTEGSYYVPLNEGFTVYTTAWYEKMYTRNAANNTLSVGYLVDSTYHKYVESTQYVTGYTPSNYYMPKDFAEANLGASPTNSTLPADTEYELQDGEYLLINYTSSTTSDDGTSTSEVKNVVYSAGDIIRPNFEIQDSVVYKSEGHSYSKTSAFDFSAYSAVTNPAGMFTLSSSQQIEIVEQAITNLAGTTEGTSKQIFVYWILNNSKAAEDGYIHFYFNEDGDTAYTLKDGEYFFFTDANKLDMAYYGSGTKIVNVGQKIDLFRDADEDDLDISTIASEGLAAAIPWTSIWLTAEDTCTIKIYEYKYVNIAEGNVLLNIIPTETSETSIVLPGAETNDYWVDNISSITYKESSDSSEITLSAPAVGDATWSVRSLLNVNCGPDQRQSITSHDSIDLYDYDTDYSYKATIVGTDTIDSIKSNYTTQSSSTKIDVSITVYDSEGIEEEGTAVNDYSIQAYKYLVPTVSKTTESSAAQTQTVSLHNYGIGSKWTSVAFKDYATIIPADYKFADFYVNFPSTNYFGLIMIYYTPDPSIAEDTNSYVNAYVKGNNVTLKKFNTTAEAAETLSLAKGINIIQIIPNNTTASTYITLFSDNHKLATVVLSDIDIISSTNALNPHIRYYVTSSATITSYEQLLSDIAANDPDNLFYYNANISSDIALDINTTITDTSNSQYEYADDPKLLYSYNNINNKFVISQIDTTAMKKGITIYNSSKK